MADDIRIPVRRLTEEAFIGGKVAVIDELLSADFIDRDPVPGMAGNREGTKQTCQLVTSAFSERQMIADELIVAGDQVIDNWTMSGRHVGEAFGIPPSGKEITIRGIEILRVADGKIVERSGVIDLSALMQQ